ncbi:hypothetical protein [Hyphomicrobium sp. 2TAF46]|uniref:hypothetical protein n=1 Tax=Hyphomicrobium sp. 2TAF46 TaxID=3233019 RepID=UPI003F92F812
MPLKCDPGDGDQVKLVSLHKGLHDIPIETLDDVPCPNKAGDSEIGSAQTLLAPSINY